MGSWGKRECIADSDEKNFAGAILIFEMSEGYDWKATAADFDRRIDRLTERQEALAQSVEMMLQSGREFQVEMREFRRGTEAIQRKNEARLAEVGEFIHSLALIAESHEKRIEHLEG